MKMVVTALLYSGVPNPSWRIDAQFAEQIARLLDSLPELHRRCEMPDNLGYTGMTMTASEPIRGDREWWFAKGIAGSAGRCFADPGREVERTLLRSGRSLIGPQVVDDLLALF